jgi:hypothetical protein
VYINERTPEHNEGITKTAAALPGLNITQKLIGRKDILSMYFRNIRFAKFSICVKEKIFQYFPG